MACSSDKGVSWPAFFLGVASSIVGSLIVFGAFKALSARKNLPLPPA